MGVECVNALDKVDESFHDQVLITVENPSGDNGKSAPQAGI